MGTENIVGVHLPVFEPFIEATSTKEMAGLGKGGQKINKCREMYTKALEALVDLASLQTTFVTLDEVIKITNRRVNAIEYVVQPRLANTIKYILSELDEMGTPKYSCLDELDGDKKKLDGMLWVYRKRRVFQIKEGSKQEEEGLGEEKA